MTEEEIPAVAMADPDGQPTMPEEMAKAAVPPLHIAAP